MQKNAVFLKVVIDQAGDLALSIEGPLLSITKRTIFEVFHSVNDCLYFSISLSTSRDNTPGVV